MKTEKTKVIYFISEPGWYTWLPEFLNDIRYETIILTNTTDNFQGLLESVAESGANLVIFLSLHSTLHRDYELGRQLRAAGIPNVIVQPQSVADLAFNKREMAGIAANIPDCLPVEEFSITTARKYLEATPCSVVVCKRNNSTEGNCLRVITSMAALDRLVGEEELGYDVILQPFIDGIEYSINVICLNDICLAYEPVLKGRTTLQGIHPCRRLRYCPDHEIDAGLRKRLLTISSDYAIYSGICGLAEIELIVKDNDIFFLEINPRLSATMRMASIACERSIFVELALRCLHPDVVETVIASSCLTAEIPVPKSSEIAMIHHEHSSIPLWISSRITTVAADRKTLDKQVRDIAQSIGFNSVDA